MRHALIVSPQAGWVAASGLADALSWLSLAAHEVAGLPVTPRGGANYAVAIAVRAPSQAAPDAAAWARAGLAGAITLTLGIGDDLRQPVAEGAVARALALAGFRLPLPGECDAIAAHVGGLAGGHAAVTAELVASLLATNRADVHGFQRACAAGRWTDARRSAHRIRGTALMAGTASLARLGQRIEILAGQGQGDTVRALALLYVPAAHQLSDALAALLGRAA